MKELRTATGTTDSGASQAPLVHVVDDDPSMRGALLRLLDAAGFEARGYPTAGDFLLQPLPDRPGCLLLDLRLPGPSGLELQAAMQQRAIHLPIVFLSGHASIESGVKAMKDGAVDFLTKPVKREILLDAIERALERDARQRASREQQSQLSARFHSLTDRQREVFELIVAGRLNKQIADELGVAERTVKREREQVMLKLGANSAADLGRLAELLRHPASG
jgi:FixJ family two-component response regulator